jgi:hypothetical protein
MTSMSQKMEGYRWITKVWNRRYETMSRINSNLPRLQFYLTCYLVAPLDLMSFREAAVQGELLHLRDGELASTPERQSNAV